MTWLQAQQIADKIITGLRSQYDQAGIRLILRACNRQYHAAKKQEVSMDVDQILTKAGVSLGKLCVESHRTGYLHIIVHVKDSVIVGADTYETTDGYYRSNNGEWHSIIKVGTGSVPCNCDACQAGEDPADWADNDDAPAAMQDQIEDGIGELMRSINDRG